MDTSKEYIDMCHKAKEVQEWKCMGLLPTWIPNQSELQEILEWNHQPRAMLLNMANWVSGGHCISKDMERSSTVKIHGKRLSTYHMKDWSPEKLWLAFIMHQKFNKTWNQMKDNWVTVPKEGELTLQ